jgi:2-keto-4-pentenoate hydratase/2-oxohepta-3-ene-1,7-dioic acid hydratase in catechol pathway
MKLISYLYQDSVRYGVLQDDGVIDIAKCLPDAPTGVNEFIALCNARPSLLDDIQARVGSCQATPLTDVTLLPSVPRPGKVVCLGVNYLDHAKEGGNKVYDYPTIFLRCATSLVAHGAPIQLSPISTALDYEAELAVVIGRVTKNVKAVDALQHVFGYTCFNDATYRDYQKRTTQWTIGKNFDQTGGFGPHLVTADELPPGCQGLHIESRLNGKVMQSANMDALIYPVAQTLELLSQCLTLEPGDVVLMGTPAGVGYARTPPVFMGAGDVIEVEIEGIGTLRNPVGAQG